MADPIGVRVGPVSYVVDSPVAARLLTAAHGAYQRGEQDMLRHYRGLAAMVEEGKLEPERALLLANLNEDSIH